MDYILYNGKYKKFFIDLSQGLLRRRPQSEKDIILGLFDASFGHIWRFATQSLVFKMPMLEAFVISQVQLFLLSTVCYVYIYVSV